MDVSALVLIPCQSGCCLGLGLASMCSGKDRCRKIANLEGVSDSNLMLGVVCSRNVRLSCTRMMLLRVKRLQFLWGWSCLVVGLDGRIAADHVLTKVELRC